MKVKGRLQHRALTGHGHNFLIDVIEQRTDAPGVAHGKHLTRTRQSAHHIAAIIMTHRCSQHIGHAYMVINVTGNIGSFQLFTLCLLVQPLHFTIQSVSHQFQRDIRIAEDTRRLSL